MPQLKDREHLSRFGEYQGYTPEAFDGWQRFSLYVTIRDGNFLAFLGDVNQNGVSTFVTRGHLRASHRAVSAPLHEFFGLLWHRSFNEVLIDLPAGQAAEMDIDLLPTTYIFRAGHRIKVTITSADGQTGAAPVLDPAPTVGVYRNSNYCSHITLPIIPPGSV